MNIDNLPSIDEDSLQHGDSSAFMLVDENEVLRPTPDMIERAIAAGKGETVTVDGLGEVEQVLPNVYRKEITMEKAFNDHLLNWDGPRMTGGSAKEALELEKRRFLMLISSRQNKTVRVQKLLEEARTEAHLDAASQMARGAGGASLTANDLLGTRGVDGEFEEMTKQADAVYEHLKAEGRIVKLESGETVQSKKTGVRMISRAAVARMRADKRFNIGVTRKLEDDKYMKRLRDQAMASRAFIEGGLQLPELDQGVSAESSVEVKQKMNEVLFGATRAIQEYERERDFITRSDGDHTQMVRANMDDFYDKMEKRAIPCKNIDELHQLNGTRIQGEINMLKESMRELMVVLETLDSAVFAPRLYLLLVRQDSPRTVEFSRVFLVYKAAMGVVQEAIKLPSQKQVDAAKARFERDFEKEARKLGAAGNIRSFENKKKSEHWTETHPSKEGISKMFTRFRLVARRDLFDRMSQLSQWYKDEAKYHAGEMEPLLRQLYTPTYTAEQIKAVPAIYAINYYGKVWEFLQDFNMEILTAYEATLLKMLAAYLPQETAEYWITNRTRPDTKRCSPITVDLLNKHNANLTEWRRFGDEPEFASVDVALVMAPPDMPAHYDDVRVSNEQSWAPTFAQLRQYHDNMNTLFQLDGSQIEVLFRRKRLAAGEELQDSFTRAKAARDKISARVFTNTAHAKTRQKRRQAYMRQQRQEKKNRAAAAAKTNKNADEDNTEE